jgi:prevent-host-death family protein
MTIILVMKVVTLAAAKAKLSALLDEVEKGGSVAISRRHRVVAEVRPAGSVRRGRARPAALAKGDFRVPADFDAPLPDDVLAPFDGR